MEEIDEGYFASILVTLSGDWLGSYFREQRPD
jgi:hypothetical protein